MTSEVKYTDYRLPHTSRPFENEVVFLSNDSVLLKYTTNKDELRVISCCVACGLQLKYSFWRSADGRWGCIAANGCGRISSVGTEVHAHGIRSSVQGWDLKEYSKVSASIQTWVARWLDVPAPSVEVGLDLGPIKGSYIL